MRSKVDIWALWPDTYMCPQEEIEENLQWRSDDYELVNVTEYDETSCPLSWEKYGCCD